MRSLLNVTFDRCEGAYDIGQILEESEAQVGSSINSLRDSYSIFHSAASTGEEHDPFDDHIDLGNDPVVSIHEELLKRVDEARAIGLSRSSPRRLEKLLSKYRNIFRLRLGN